MVDKKSEFYRVANLPNEERAKFRKECLEKSTEKK